MATELAPVPVTVAQKTPWLIRSRLARVSAGALLIIAMAPTIVSWTPLVDWLAGGALGRSDVRLRIGSTSLGWFSNQVLRDVEIRDAAGEPLATVAKIECRRSLLGLAWNHQNLGTIRIEQPQVHVEMTGATTNFEKLMAPKREAAPAKSPKAAAAPLRLVLEIVDAKIHLNNPDRGQAWTIAPLQMTLRLNQDKKQPIHVVLHAAVDGTAGSIDAEATLQSPVEGVLSAKLTAFPLASLEMVLRRWQPDLILEGQLAGHCQGSWKFPASGPPEASLDGELSGKQCRIHLAALGSAPIVLDEIATPCQVKLHGTRLHVEKAGLTCPVGRTSVQGDIDWSHGWQHHIQQPGLDVRVDLDAAKLAAVAPALLQLHSDVQIHDGKLTAFCKSSAGADGVVWEAKVVAENLRGERAGRPIAWTDPLAVEVRLRLPRSGPPIVERLHASASFIKRFEASGDAEQCSLQADVDLDQLAQALGQFVDFGSLRMSGTAAWNLGWQIRADQQTQFNAKATLDRLRLEWGVGSGWNEERLNLDATALGKIVGNDLQRLDKVYVQVRAGGDVAEVQLLEPIADVRQGPWGCFARLEGDLQRWQRRVRPFAAGLDAWQLQGVVQGKAWVRASLQDVEVQSVVLSAKDFQCVGVGLAIREPTFDVQASGRWEHATASLGLKASQVRCPSLVIHTPQFEVDGVRHTASSRLLFQGHLPRLQQWLKDPKAPPATPIAGSASGQIDVQASAARTSFDVSANVKDFVYGPPTAPLWREPQLKLLGRGGVDLAKDRIALDHFELRGQALAVEGQGHCNSLNNAMEVDAGGQLHYDLEKLEAMLRTYLGATAKIVGKDARPFRIKGPLLAGAGPTLTIAKLEGNAGFSWKTLKAYGCDVGPAEVRTRLNVGWVNLLPIDTQVNGGKLHVQARLRLEPAPMLMTVPAGQVLERAQITPEMCKSALGYALPTLANVAEANGMLSLALEHGRLPMAEPTKADIKGTLTLHAAKVSPGAAIKKFSEVLRLPAAYGTIKESQVPFHMVNGRVHHRDLELVFPDFSLKTSGSVGLEDGTLQLVGELKVSAKSSNPLVANMSKQTWKVPIQGTMENPQVDLRGVLQSAPANLLTPRLENEFNKLLRPRGK